MEFFDRKGDVLDIQLTSAGKKLLSLGKFKPRYYAFFDDDVIYDYERAGVSDESQYDIIQRIKETPRLKTQASFTGYDQKKNERKVLDKKQLFKYSLQPDREKTYSLTSQLGTVDPQNSDNYPSWELTLWNGVLTGSIAYDTASYNEFARTPLLNAEINYKTFACNKDNKIESKNLRVIDLRAIEDDAGPIEFADGSMITFQDDFLLLDLKENGTEYLNENFTIEVFKMDKDGLEIPLKFANDGGDRIINNILLDPIDTLTELTPDHVEYYFEFAIDTDIDPKIFCNYVEEADVDVITGRMFSCEVDKEPIQFKNQMFKHIANDPGCKEGK